MKLALRPLLILAASLSAASLASAAGDWNQWRGPTRNGIAVSSPPLADAWPADGPKVLWDSESIPSNDNGGHGSIVAANGKAYLSVVWHTDVPTETRAINDLVLRKLGQRSTSSLGPELTAKMETARLGLGPRLRGNKLDEWAKNWVDKNFNQKQNQTLGSWAVSRFKKGKAALSIETLERLNQIRKRRFVNETEMLNWIAAQGFGEDTNKRIVAAVPNTRKSAQDVVLCIDMETGKTLWKSETPAESTGRNSSSTPCVADARVYSIGSGRAFCVDADTGKQIWSTDLQTKSAATSPMLVEGLVVFTAGRLTALDAKTGKIVWDQKQVGGNNASPALWRKNDRNFLICSSKRNLACVDPKNGKIVWTTAGGGDSTPCIVGNTMAAYSRVTEVGLSVYTLSETGATKRWSHVLDARRTQTSPIIHDGHVYLMGAGYQLCADLESGEIRWKEPQDSNISSPLLADGKLFVFGKKGGDLQMIKATPDARVELAAGKVRAMWCPSPTISNGRILLRLADRIRCYDAAAPNADLR
jgi:outer membrane protein assembly factor BamB